MNYTLLAKVEGMMLNGMVIKIHNVHGEKVPLALT